MIESVLCDRGEPHEVCPGPRPEKDVGALSHLVTPDVRNNQSLTMEFVCSLDSRGYHRMCLRGVRTDNHHE